MNRFFSYICAAVLLSVFQSAVYLNAQTKEKAGGADKSKPVAAQTPAKPEDKKVTPSTGGAAAPKAAEPKPVANNKPQTHYKAWNADEELKNLKDSDWKKRKDDIVKGLSGGANPERDKFFETSYFARWTDPEKQGEVQGYLDEFITKDLKELSGAGRTYLLAKSFDLLKKMTADTAVVPTARYNAVLAIGHLTQAEPKDRNAIPTAYAPALPYLIEQYNKADNPEYIKLGALLGIVRHCAMGIADNNLKTAAVPDILIKIITDGTPAADSDKDVQFLRNCFRQRAIDGLAYLGKIGNNGNVMKLFYDILENINENAEMRVRAARALGELNYKETGEAKPPVSYEQTGLSLLNYTKQLCDSEIQIISDLLDKAKAETGGVASLGGDMGMSSSMGMSPMTGSGTAAGQVNTGPSFDSLPVEKKLEVINVFQRVKSEFSDIHFGIRGGFRPTGSKDIKAGVQSVIPAESPAVAKWNKAAAAMVNMFRYLDEKDEQQKKLEEARNKNKKPARSMSDSSMGMPEEMSMSSSGMGSAGSSAVPEDMENVIKPLKVNLGDIQEALKTFSTELDKILTSG